MIRQKSIPYINDMMVYKRKHRLIEDQKVFIIIGGYPDIRQALLDRSKLVIRLI